MSERPVIRGCNEEALTSDLPRILADFLITCQGRGVFLSYADYQALQMLEQEISCQSDLVALIEEELSRYNEKVNEKVKTKPARVIPFRLEKVSARILKKYRDWQRVKES